MNRQLAQGLSCSALFLLCHMSYAALVNSNTSQTNRLRVTNQCTEPLWIQQDYQHTTNDPVVVQVPPGQSYDYIIPDKGLASTRFWPKSGCDAQGYNCTVGESTGVPDAITKGYQKGPFAPDINSKFEATWGCLQAIHDNNPSACATNPSAPSQYLSAQTWWNGSAVDGYTLPYAIHVKNHNNSCTDSHSGKVLTNPDVDCSRLSVSACPQNENLSTEGQYNLINGKDVTRVNLQWLAPKTGTVVGCFSPCSKLTTAQGSDNGQTGGGWSIILGGLTPPSPEAQMYCCPTPPVTPGACSAGPAARSTYLQSVQQTQGCNSYTYAYDDALGLAVCNAETRFEVVFCPTAPQPSPTPTPTPSVSASMTFIVPTTVQAKANGVVVTTNQTVSLANGSILSMNDSATATCTLNVDAQSHVTTTSGNLCSQLSIDNAAKTITFPAAALSNLQLQFNINTSFGITAYLDNTPLVNATPIDAAGFSANPVLKAYQGDKQGTCTLTITSTTAQKGSGELCNRLNIVPEANHKVSIYLPADIPNTGGAGTQPAPTPAPTAPPKYVVFGMESSTYAKFSSHQVTNGSKVALDSLGDLKTIDIVAYQNQTSASCIIGKSGDTLNIVPNTGLLCEGGLVLMTQSNGDYYIGLPNKLPVPVGSVAYGLGIAQGMSIGVSSQTVKWDSKDKTVYFPQGTTQVSITGNNKLVRVCSMTLNNTVLTWPNTPECQGVVVNGGILYFPAF